FLLFAYPLTAFPTKFLTFLFATALQAGHGSLYFFFNFFLRNFFYFFSFFRFSFGGSLFVLRSSGCAARRHFSPAVPAPFFLCFFAFCIIFVGTALSSSGLCRFFISGGCTVSFFLFLFLSGFEFFGINFSENFQAAKFGRFMAYEFGLFGFFIRQRFTFLVFYLNGRAFFFL